jgi:ATP-dependent DNA ligase
MDPRKIQDKMDHYIYKKYEGLMVRFDDVPYEYGKRSPNLLKWKYVMDGEFEVVHITYERRMEGGMKYLVEFHCKFTNGKTFKVVPKWSVERRHQWWLDNKDKKVEDILPNLLPLLVEYRELTVNGMPFHAVGIDFREHGY